MSEVRDTIQPLKAIEDMQARVDIADCRLKIAHSSIRNSGVRMTSLSNRQHSKNCSVTRERNSETGHYRMMCKLDRVWHVDEDNKPK